jgi:hypothetical protein
MTSPPVITSQIPGCDRDPRLRPLTGSLAPNPRSQRDIWAMCPGRGGSGHGWAGHPAERSAIDRSHPTNGSDPTIGRWPDPPGAGGDPLAGRTPWADWSDRRCRRREKSGRGWTAPMELARRHAVHCDTKRLLGRKRVAHPDLGDHPAPPHRVRRQSRRTDPRFAGLRPRRPDPTALSQPFRGRRGAPVHSSG